MRTHQLGSCEDTPARCDVIGNLFPIKLPNEDTKGPRREDPITDLPGFMDRDPETGLHG